MNELPLLRLRPGEHHRIRHGHLWVYHDELEPPLPSLEAGSLVRVETSYGYNLGIGFYHPTSKIAVRLLLWDNAVNEDFFVARLERALALRRAFYGESTVYRLAFGEADFLPGLVVDRYGDVVAVQYLSAGMDRRSSLIISAIRQVLPSVRGIVAKNDSVLREKEGLPRQEAILWGSVPDRIELAIGSIRMHVDILGGQKTGLYLDQRANYELVARFARGDGCSIASRTRAALPCTALRVALPRWSALIAPMPHLPWRNATLHSTVLPIAADSSRQMSLSF